MTSSINISTAGDMMSAKYGNDAMDMPLTGSDAGTGGDDSGRGPRRPQRALSLLAPAQLTRKAAWCVAICGSIALALSAYLLLVYTANPHEFPVNEVEVLGTLGYTDRDRMRERVMLHTSDGFYRVDLDSIRRDIMSFPWVAEVHARRLWPDRVSIDVIEHEPSARWNEDGLISKRFEMFRPPQLGGENVQRAEWVAYFADLPKLTGETGRHEAVLSAYRTYQVYLSSLGMSISALLEDERHSQTLVLENSVSVRLGTSELEPRIQRFVDVYPRLIRSTEGKPVTFDMRYTNGFAMTAPGSPTALSAIDVSP